MRVIQNLFLITGFLLTSVYLNANPTFILGNEAHQSGEYANAIELYEESLEATQSLEQHFNMGNAFYQNGEYGKAILHYKKALVFNPSHPDVLANLNLARESLKMLNAESPSSLTILVNVFSLDTWTWILVSAFWLFVGVIILSRAYSISYLVKNGIVWASIVVGATSLGALYYFHGEKDLGVVLVDDAPLKVAPTTTSPKTAMLNEGTTGKVLDQHADHYFITTPDKHEGWIHEDAFSKVLD